MASALAAQLSAIQKAQPYTTTSILDPKKLKREHGVSLLYSQSQAVSQDFETLYQIAIEGFEELCALDSRFHAFEKSLFSEDSKNVDRETMPKDDNRKLDEKISRFLELVGGWVLVRSGQKAVEWLVRRFRIHHHNTALLLLTFLPYHQHPIFMRVISIIPRSLPADFNFLTPYRKAVNTPVSRTVILTALTQSPPFFKLVADHVLSVVRNKHAGSTLVRFWGGISLETLGALLDRAVTSGKSGFTEEDIVQRFLPVISDSLEAGKRSAEFQIGTYMLLSLLALRTSLEMKISVALMGAVTANWTPETVVPAIASLSLLAQQMQDSAPALSIQVASDVLKIEDIPAKLAELGEKYRADKLCTGICVTFLRDHNKMKKQLHNGLELVRKGLASNRILKAQKKAIINTLLIAVTKESGSEDFVTLIEELKFSDVFQEVLSETDTDIEVLELRLGMVLMGKKAEGTDNGADTTKMDIEVLPDVNNSDASQQITFEDLLQKLPTTSGQPSFLSSDANDEFPNIAKTFLSASENFQRDIPTLFSSPFFQNDDVLSLTLCIRIFTGRFPTLARETALNYCTSYLEANSTPTDYQALLPHVLSALSDPSQRVREAAGKAVRAVCQHIKRSQKKGKQQRVWGPTTVYGTQTSSVKWLSGEEAKKFVDKVLSAGLDECTMDQTHVCRVVPKNISGLKSSLKRSVLAYLTSHVLCAPGALFKSRMLTVLYSVTSSARTTALLPILTWWEELSGEQRVELLAKENVQIEDFQQQIVKIVDTSDSGDGVNTLLKVLSKQGETKSFVKAAADRLEWLCRHGLGMELETRVARQLLLLALSGDDQSEPRPGAGEAIEILRRIIIQDSVYLEFLSDAGPQLEDSETGEHQSKKRRTSPTGHDPDFSRRLTLVLELLEAEYPGNHKELLGPLFNVLSSILKSSDSNLSGRDYLMQVILSCITQIVSVYKSRSSPISLDSDAVRADILVTCIRSTSNPQVQNSALLLVAALADVIPEVVLHSVMPIFTFMGASTLKHDDEYSAHVIEQTIHKVIPPLVRTFHFEGTNPIIGAAELLSSFVAAFGHIPSHRRLKLFTALTKTLGTLDFLFAILTMLAEKYNEEKRHVKSDEGVVKEFCVSFAGAFEPELQLDAVGRMLHATWELFSTTPSEVSVQLLKAKDREFTDKVELVKSVGEVCCAILSSRKLRTLTARGFKDPDSKEAADLRDTCTTCMQMILHIENQFSSSSHEDASVNFKPLMKALLELLPTTDFVSVIEELLQSKSLNVRNQALCTFKSRVSTESKANVESRTAIMKLTTKIASSLAKAETEAELKANVLSCIDTVVVRFGNQEGNALSKLADVILGDGALRSSEKDLQVLSLVCMSSITKCINGRMIPFLPKIFPYTLELWHTCMKEQAWHVHNAVVVFLEGLVSVIPNFMTTYLERILSLSFESARVEVEDDSDSDSDSSSSSSSDDENEEDEKDKQKSIAHTLRNDLSAKIAEKIEAKKLFTALIATWSSALSNGVLSVSESLAILQKCIANAPKSTIIACHALLLKFFQQTMDLRRLSTTFDDEDIRMSEEQMFNVAIQMVFKLNDTTFRPMFSKIYEWASEGLKGDDDKKGTRKRLRTFYGFFDELIKQLGSLITSYYSAVLDDSITLLDTLKTETSAENVELWEIIIKSLTKSFSTDQNEFWQTPTNFDKITPTLLSLLPHTHLPITTSLIPSIVELANAAQSEEHFKTINSAILKHMRSDDSGTRMNAVVLLTELYERLGEEWLNMLPETVPVIAELMEDDDEEVERAVQRMVVKIEGYLGESLDTMLT